MPEKTKKARGDILGEVAVDLLSVPPLIFRVIRRKLIMGTLADIDVDLKLLHFEVMRVLKEKGTLHPAEIGDCLQIAKAQMTHLIDRLVELGLVEREIDPDDRRTLDIGLTAKGKKLMEEHHGCLVHAVEENMATLSDDELETLCDSLRNLRDTLSRLQ